MGTFQEPRNRFQEIDSASLSSLAGRYDNPIPTRFPGYLKSQYLTASKFRQSFNKQKEFHPIVVLNDCLQIRGTFPVCGVNNLP
jgi:hypothetical protein